MSDPPTDLIELGQAVAVFLADLANPGSSVDTGSDGGEYECFVTIGSTEWKVTVRPYWDETRDEPV